MCSPAVIQISSSPVDAKRGQTEKSVRAGEMDVRMAVIQISYSRVLDAFRQLSSSTPVDATLLLGGTRQTKDAEIIMIFLFLLSYPRRKAEEGRRPPVDQVNKIQILRVRLELQGEPSSNAAVRRCRDSIPSSRPPLCRWNSLVTYKGELQEGIEKNTKEGIQKGYNTDANAWVPTISQPLLDHTTNGWWSYLPL